MLFEVLRGIVGVITAALCGSVMVQLIVELLRPQQRRRRMRP